MIIDSVVEQPNVQSVVFKEHEGSFLVGMAAAMASKTGKVGFVGGMDIPLIRNFALGYEQGVKHVSPDAEVFVNMTGTTPAAWNDPAKGGELAHSQFDRGADVVYAAAGGTGLGVLAGGGGHGQALDRRRQQPELPASRQRADLDAQARRRRGLQCLQDRPRTAPGSRARRASASTEDGVGYALDDHNRQLITPEMEAKLEEAKADDHRRQAEGRATTTGP